MPKPWRSNLFTLLTPRLAEELAGNIVITYNKPD
jgi:hypothetical protein